jgi:hypothetical protein
MSGPSFNQTARYRWREKSEAAKTDASDTSYFLKLALNLSRNLKGTISACNMNRTIIKSQQQKGEI